LLKFLAPCWIVLLVSTWFAVKSAARTRSNEDIRHEVSKFVNDHRKELWEGKSVMKSFSRETSKRKDLIRLFRKAGMVLPREEGERKKLSSERHREEEQAVRSEPAERNGDERALQEDQQKRRKAVIGGNFSPIFRYPYMVTVKFKWSGNAKHTHTCGGSLIAPDIVLSAAHCYEASWGNPKVVVGDHDLTSSDDAGEEFDAKVLAIHPEYSSFFITSDIMLFQIINGQVSTHPPVRLNKDPSVPVANQKVDVIGWGTIDPQGQIGTDVLKETQLEAVPQDRCLQFGSSKIHGPDIICAADLDGKVDEDACEGDSGGPLIIKGANFTQDVQIALVSHGPFPCAQPSPGMYTGISYFYEWISGYVCDVSVSPPPDFGCQPTTSPAPTASTSPSLNPSSSFSPTGTKVPITLVIKLDKYPEDVSWYIIRQTSSSTIDIVKDAVYKKEQEYSNNPQNSTVYEYLYLIPDQSYLLVMDDSYGDGICCSSGQGYYFLYWGHENKNFLENLKIFKGDGNYQSIAVVPFNTTELYKNAPSLSPSLSYSPSTTKAPSTYPSSSMSPTITHTLVTLFIQFDNYPSDVSWEIRLANSTQTQPLFKGGNYYFDQTYNGQKK
jgi:secreted trypsin-like serine protease